VSYIRHVPISTNAHETRAARPPLNLNSSKYVQHRIRALRLMPLEASSCTISLAMCEMLGAALEWPAHSLWLSCARAPPRPHLKYQEGPRRSSAAPPSVRPTLSPRCRCPPRWSVAYDVRCDPERRSLPGADYLQHPDNARNPPTTWKPPQARSTVPTTPTRSTPRRRELKPDPHYQLHA